MFTEQELNQAKTLIIDKVNANGYEVHEVKAVPKSRDAVLLTLKVEGDDGDRFAVITRAELS